MFLSLAYYYVDGNNVTYKYLKSNGFIVCFRVNRPK